MEPTNKKPKRSKETAKSLQPTCGPFVSMSSMTGPRSGSFRSAATAGLFKKSTRNKRGGKKFETDGLRGTGEMWHIKAHLKKIFRP